MVDSLMLAFEFTALEALQNPATAFEDARTWSTSVGVATEQPVSRVVNELRALGIYREDFLCRLDSPARLARIETEIDADRTLLVSRNAESTSAIPKSGWACLTVDEAADKAGWELATGASRGPDQ